ncbi:hypothetical protein B0H13DRAFT_2667411 [Mycena leptocephala]|nr:hypothetical protein B0H13DRAFT_2667411 [Mycena leptocephala]
MDDVRHNDAEQEYEQEHGLRHARGFLGGLPVLSLPSPVPLPGHGSGEGARHEAGGKAHILTAPQFAALHTAHILAHPPDGVLFPFLHGLEGDNHAQNTFFEGSRSDAAAGRRRRKAPRFRGLVWVVAEEEEELPRMTGGVGEEEGEYDDEDESDEEDEEESEEEDELVGMDVDGDGVRIAGDGEEGPPIATLEQREDGKHMHPVHHRLQALQTSGLPPGTPSTAASDDIERFFATPITALGEDVQMEISLPPPSTPPTTSTLSALSASSSGGSSTSGSGSGSSSSSYSSGSVLDASLPGPPTHTSSPSHPEQNVDGQNTTNGKQEANPNGNARHPPEEEWDPARPPLLTCTFRARELVRRVGSGVSTERPALVRSAPNGAAHDQARHQAQAGQEKTKEEQAQEQEEWEFRPARVPDGISLRNFGIQVPIYATLSDVVLYSPRGLSSPALKAQAARFVSAVARKRRERCKVLGIDPDMPSPDAPLEYNVFVLDADARTLRETVPELMMRVFEGGDRRGVGMGMHVPEQNEGMDVDSDADAAHLEAHVPGAHPDPHTTPSDAPVAVPIHPEADATCAPNTVDFGQRERDEMRELTRASEILSVFPHAAADEEREELATTTTASHWRPAVGQVGGPAEDPFAWEATNAPKEGMGYDVCVECHEMAPFPSLAHLRAAEDHLAMLDGMWDERMRRKEGRGDAPSNTAQTMNALLPVIAFLERCLRPIPPRPPPSNSNSSSVNNSNNSSAVSTPGARRWSTFPATVATAAFFPSPPPPPGAMPRTRSLTSPAPSPAPTTPPRTRPLKVLIYSSDGYTESSPLALSLLMAVRRLSLPEAYLELQVAKRRSFFVYPGELGLLRRVEARIGGGEVFAPSRLGRRMSGAGASTGSLGSAGGAQVASAVNAGSEGPSPAPTPTYAGARPSAKSVSFAPGAATPPPIVPSQAGAVTRAGRPRARTSPWLPSFGDHQSWFNDPRFDGSFPSRVLPFLYLGNLNHASNAYMLHALGITHVVSVGECALVPPPGHCGSPGDACTSAACRANHSGNAHFIQGKGPGNQGSLWIEEREGRIKVLDIKGVCDDGIDTLEPQLEPICEWIEKARQEGGQVLVHCRVGVSRSATVTIAYVMKHLSLPLVDAYLIVRSRRLSVLIQPNMRLLYNLCGWEIKLAKERAGEDERRLRKELARTLTWPYLSKEVHALNEKYLH